MEPGPAQEVATQTTVTGDYTVFRFDVTGLLKGPGVTNSLALYIYPNQPNTMFTLDGVDWTEISADHNTGIQFPVQIDYYGNLALNNSHVVENNAPDMSSSALTVKGDVTNPTSSAQTGTVTATVTDPQNNRVATLSQAVTGACKQHADGGLRSAGPTRR